MNTPSSRSLSLTQRALSPLMQEEHVVLVSPSFSWSDLKTTLTRFYEKLEPLVEGDEDGDFTLLPQFCKELKAFLDASDPDARDSVKILEEWKEKVATLKENENFIAAVDIPTIVLIVHNPRNQ